MKALNTQKAARVGIIGGTFDPIHAGHIALAKAAKRLYNLDLIILMPSGQPPHKEAEQLTAKEDRYAMSALVAEHEGFFVSRLEMDREGTIYTIDSLNLIKEAMPESEIYFIIGSDTLLSMDQWKNAQEAIGKAIYIDFVRNGRTVGDDERYVSRHFLKQSQQFLFSAYQAPDVSSSQIRKRVAQELELDGFLPEYLIKYIAERGLYKRAALNFEEAKKKLKRKLSGGRFNHTLGVVEMAERLAQKHGISLMRTRWAALLHDCAKEEGDPPRPGCNCNLFDDFGVDKMEIFAPHLLHAPMGVVVAHMDYGMEDEEILLAILRHTTGAETMSDLDKLIYLADYIELGRRDSPRLQELRELAFDNMDKAMLQALDESLTYLAESGKYIHKNTFLARDAFWRKQYIYELTEKG